MTRTQVNAAQPSRELKAPSRRAVALLSVYLRWYMARHFHSARVANAERISPDAEPLILFNNHASWWDPLTAMLLAQTILPEREHFVATDASFLAGRRIFRPMGFFPVNQNAAGGAARGVAQLTRAGADVLARPGAALWVTPESTVQDVRSRPLVFRPGIGTLISRRGRLTCIPVAIEYVFWNEHLPEILINIGEPLEIGDGTMEEPRTWTNLLSYATAATQDELAMLVTERDPANFEVILASPNNAGGISGLRQRIRYAVTGQS